MTDLQASLVIIGGILLVGVFTYNKWQEYKAKKSVQRAFSSEHDDVLMDPEMNINADAADGRQEPTMAPDAFETEGVDGSQEVPLQPEVSEQVPSAQAAQKELPVDELIDCPIPLALETPIRGEKLLPKLQKLHYVGNKPVHFIAQRTDGGWEPVTHGSTYRGLLAGVQLANRSSALNELEYSELITRLRQISDEIDAEPDVPDMSKVMASARALHQSVAEYDAKLSVNVRSKGAPWATDTLLGALERHGFDLRPDGLLVMPDGDGGILFSLSTNVTLAAEATSRLTLLLDVPRVAPSRDAFGAMSACAKVLATRLDGIVVDDGNQPLTDEALAEIAEQVRDFYSYMEAANIPAGSTRALRLFS